jgi:hypothetical protein
MYLADNKSTTLSAAITSVSTSLTTVDTGLGSPSGLVEFAVDYDVPASYEKMLGVISGTSISGLIRGVGGTAAVSHAAGAKVAIVNSKEHYDLVANFAKTGWTLLDPQTISLASSLTFSYVGANSFTVTGDWTSTLSVGDKIRLINNSTTKYFFIESLSYSSPNTTIGVKDGITRTTTTLASGTISVVNYSKLDFPSGFPASATFFDEAKVYQNTTTSTMTNNTWSKFTSLNAEEYDTNNLHDNSTNNERVTVRHTGTYQIQYKGAFTHVGANTIASLRGVQLYKNGASLANEGMFISNNVDNIGNNDVSINTSVRLNAGDYIEVWGFQNCGANLTGRGAVISVKLVSLG